MTLPARQQRALDRIGETLAADDPGLGSMFTIFTRLTRNEPMPMTERVRDRLKRLRIPAMAVSITLIAVLSVLIFSFPVHSPNICGSGIVTEFRLARALTRTTRCPPVPANPRARPFSHSGK